MTFTEQLETALRADPAKPAMEYKGRVFTKGDIVGLSDRTLALLDEAGIAKGASVGVIVRNRPLHAAAMLGLIFRGRWLTTIYAMQSPESVAEELRTSKFAAVIADPQDWSPQAIEAAKEAGSLGIRLSLTDKDMISLQPGLEKTGPGPFRVVEGEPGLEILSSGTTGKPKRIVFPSRIMVRMVESVMAGRAGPPQPEVLVWPYGGIGGMSNLVAGPLIGRYTVLLDKFNVPDWVEGIERLKPTQASIVPAVARMVLDAKVPKEKLASLKAVFGGSAPMSPELQEEWEAAYGIPVIWAYGATEFCGTVISWTPALYQEFKDKKRGSMGRVLNGIQLRVTDIDTGEVVPANKDGYLEALVPTVSDKWLKTTDIVTIDEDGFVFHKGRGDGAILRGGYKVLPEKVVDALRDHPAVLDAAVIGVEDQRLGAVPMAAVELRSGFARPNETELQDFLRKKLIAPQIPTRVVVLDVLPRTPSMKVDLTATRKAILSDPAPA
jgi:long-chain acyl-CoA synthetase